MGEGREAAKRTGRDGRTGQTGREHRNAEAKVGAGAIVGSAETKAVRQGRGVENEDMVTGGCGGCGEDGTQTWTRRCDIG